VATLTLGDVLNPKAVNKAISRLKVRNTRLQNFFGMGLGGPNVEGFGGRDFFWDIYDDIRKVATARHPGQPSARIEANPVGEVRGAFPRAAETVLILHEKVHNLRSIGGPVGVLDERGINYINRQERTLKQRFTNLREFQVAAMLRGSYTYSRSGDLLFHDFSGGTQTINFQIPAASLGNLGGIIAASWDNAATDIPGHIDEINAQMEIDHGMPLQHVLINSIGMSNVLNNTAVKALAGTANTVFERFDQIEGTTDFLIVLKGIPWLKWHVINEVLDVGSSYTTTKLIADTQATFLPDPGPDWLAYYEGSEVVTEYTGGPQALRQGGYFWPKPVDDPSGVELKGIHNGIPALFVPKAIKTGTVVF
jgi:hypothetical protein